MLVSRLLTSNLGTVYRNLGELERAKEYHILAIEIEKEKLGPQHVGLTRLLSKLRRTGKGERISYTSDRNSERKTWSTTCCLALSRLLTATLVQFIRT